MSVRHEVAALLEADWANIPTLASLRVIATERRLDEISTSTALIRSRTIGRAPAAPNSHRHVGLLLTLVSKHTDLDRAQDELDELVEAALDYLDTHCQHEDATTAGWNDNRLAYDIPLTILASKE